MYEASENFLEKLNAGAIQKIRGKIETVTGRKIILNDENLIGSPRYEKQCVEDSESFMFGQLYTGTIELTANIPDILRDELRGGKVSLEFGLDGLDERIPLGEWTIDNPERDAEQRLIIRGSDCISKLNIKIDDPFVGAVGVKAAMEKVTELTGVEFAQTLDEISEISGISLINYFGSTYSATCRDEVIAIAEIIGGFAFANREGKIEFRKFGKEPVLTIDAKQRFRAKLSEYTYGIRGVGYADKYGKTGFYRWNGTDVNTSATLIFSGNRYVQEGTWANYSDENPDRSYKMWLEPIGKNLTLPYWVSGEIEFYGNPCLDSGDMVQISGGVNGENPTRFLITSDYWQFRSPQTLISAGASENSVSSGSGSSGVSQTITTVNVSKTLAAVEFSAYAGELTETLETVGECVFSCRSQTLVFVEMTANLNGNSNSEVRFHILIDGVKQTVHTSDSIAENQLKTICFRVPLTVGQGNHMAEIEASGGCKITRINAVIWGQEITEFVPQQTSENDYIYHISDGSAVIDKYTGKSLFPKIPDNLSDCPVKILGGNSFTESDAEYAYIPEGVEEIE